MAHIVIWTKPTMVKNATGTHWVITVKPSQVPSCEGNPKTLGPHSGTTQQQGDKVAKINKHPYTQACTITWLVDAMLCRETAWGKKEVQGVCQLTPC